MTNSTQVKKTIMKELLPTFGPIKNFFPLVPCSFPSPLQSPFGFMWTNLVLGSREPLSSGMHCWCQISIFESKWVILWSNVVNKSCLVRDEAHPFIGTGARMSFCQAVRYKTTTNCYWRNNFAMPKSKFWRVVCCVVQVVAVAKNCATRISITHTPK